MSTQYNSSIAQRDMNDMMVVLCGGREIAVCCLSLFHVVQEARVVVKYVRHPQLPVSSDGVP